VRAGPTLAGLLQRHGRTALGLGLCWAFAAPPLAWAQSAAALQARHGDLHDKLASNAFQRPLVLESSEAPSGLKGEIYARIDQPFGIVAAALGNGSHWCDILILHLNVRQCRFSGTPPGETLQLALGSKHDRPLEQAYRLAFAYRLVAAQPDYLHVSLTADEGPLDTRDYHITLEVVAVDPRRSFLHLSYAYDYGAAARLAMQAYLATLGRDKVGFSVIGRKPDGQAQFVGSTRGVVERNTMRYYLAIEAYLGALSLPRAQQFERRLADWHSGVERYPLQLHELERDEYLALKRAQVRRQQAGG
jgi:hypothetical protein